MRDKAYRRWVEDKKVKKRLSNNTYTYWTHYFKDINNVSIYHVKLKDLIGTENYFRFRNSASCYKDKYKCKYAQNCGNYWSGNKKSCRVADKVKLLNLLREYGIK